MAKLYSEMSQEEVDALIREKVPKGSFVYEIVCGGMSAITFGEMWRNGKIGYYLGCSIDENNVHEAIEQGLSARSITKNFNHKIHFESLKKSGGNKAVVAMFKLPEIAPKAAESYAKQARALEIAVVSYPEIQIL